MQVTQLGFCLRVIVNEKLLNLEKTTSDALSVLLLIYDPLSRYFHLKTKIYRSQKSIARRYGQLIAKTFYFDIPSRIIFYQIF